MAVRKDRMWEKSKTVESWLTDHGMKFEWVPDLPIAEIDVEAGLANQARLHDPLHELTVATYLEAMERGDTFPAIVVVRPNASVKATPVDGNHRAKSAILAGRESVAAYVVQGEPSSTRIIALTMEANARHGQPVPMDERLEQAVWMVNGAGISQTKAAAALNLPLGSLRMRISRDKAEQRGTNAGVKPAVWNSLSIGIRAKIAQIKTDEGVKAAALLADSAKLTLAEVTELVEHANETSSAAKQVQAIKAFGEQYADRSEASAGGLIGRKSTPRQRFTLALSNLMSLPDNLGSALAKSYAAPERADAARQARAAAEKLTQLADTLEK